MLLGILHNMHDDMEQHLVMSRIWLKNPSGKELIEGICKEI